MRAAHNWKVYSAGTRHARPGLADRRPPVRRHTESYVYRYLLVGESTSRPPMALSLLALGPLRVPVDSVAPRPPGARATPHLRDERKSMAAGQLVSNVWYVQDLVKRANEQ